MTRAPAAAIAAAVRVRNIRERDNPKILFN
jgi:hypothetical protein